MYTTCTNSEGDVFCSLALLVLERPGLLLEELFYAVLQVQVVVDTGRTQFLTGDGVYVVVMGQLFLETLLFVGVSQLSGDGVEHDLVGERVE